MIHIGHYCVYEVQGESALNFLQGQITNDVLNISDDESIPALLCNVQGRILSMLYVIKKYEQIFIILRHDLHQILENNLLKVAALSRVKLTLRHDLNVYHDERFIISKERINENQNLDEWHLARIKAHEFDIYPSSSGLFLPQDLGLEEKWISFTKGCYRGQEIIARMHYLGKSKYHLVDGESSDSLLKAGDKIDASTYVVDLLNQGDKISLLLCVKKPTLV